jgi:ubiquinone/menaquinone biosynthesis C-methylase UbiE
MNAKYSHSEIFAFWTRQAREHEQSPSATGSDTRVIDLEIDEITKWLHDGDVVLDAGCANGYSSIKFARARRIRLRGVDYVPEMVEQARLKAAALRDKLKESIEFDVGDITKLQEQSASYDKVVVIRVLINLGTWERQAQGLRECTRVLKPGGVLLLCEATLGMGAAQSPASLNGASKTFRCRPSINTWTRSKWSPRRRKSWI